MPQTLIACLGFLGGAVVAVVDGPRAVRVAALVSGLALAPAASSIGGDTAGLAMIAAGLTATVASVLSQRLATTWRAIPGLDPDVPVVAPEDPLFGPRSVRVIGAALAVLAASWAGLNVQVGGAATAQGAVFAASYIWLVGAVRLVRARSLEDLAIAGVAVSLAGATGWILQAGPNSVPEALAGAGLAPLAAAAVGWLKGRHRSLAEEPAL
jgi:hypothetical protein